MTPVKTNNCERLEKVLDDLREVYTNLLEDIKNNQDLDKAESMHRTAYYSGGLNILNRIAHQLKYFPIKKEGTNEQTTNI